MTSLIFLIFFVRSSFAFDTVEYQARRADLNYKQVQTQALLSRMGMPLGFNEGTGAAVLGEASVKSSLFRVHSDLSSVSIPGGKFLYGRLLNRLVVGSDESPVLIVLDQGQGSLSGVRVKGVARQGGTEGRVAIDLKKLLLRSGRGIDFQGSGLDESGAKGLSAEVISGKFLAVAGAMGSSFIAGLAASQQTENVNAFGFKTPEPSGRNAILQGVGQSAADQSKRLIDDATKEKPILIVESLTPVVVLVEEEVRF